MDLAFTSARVFTADPNRPWVEAVAVKDGRVALVGSTAEIKRACGPRTQVVDLPGRLVTAGLVDAHLHFLSFGRSLKLVDLRGLTSWEACRERIRTAAARLKPGQWLLGRNWNQHLWPGQEEPTKDGLDDLTPHHPVMLVRVCGHTVVLNSLALERAGITAQTPDPPGRRIERDEKGEPNGLFRRGRQYMEQFIPKPTPEELVEHARAAQAEALRCGLTGVHTCETLSEYLALQALDQAGQLKIRVHHLLPPEDLAAAAARGIKPGAGGERLWFSQVKLYADGSLGSATALLHEPYCDAETCGLAYESAESLQEKMELAYAHGCDVAVHAIGDKAVTNALEAYAGARRKFPGAWRDRIEHVQLYRPQDLAMFKELGVVASVQPVFVPTDWAAAEKKWGLERCRHSYAWRTLGEAGIPLQFGSDAPVEPIAPILGLAAAVCRQTVDGRPQGGWRTEECLTLEESLAGFVRVAAWTARHDQVLGALTPGRWADLTVFSRDLADLPAQDWPRVQAEMTVIGGEIVHQA